MVMMFHGHDIPRDDNRMVTLCTSFVRAQQSFQATIVLAELGMLSDARVVLRSAVEGTIALHGLEEDAAFVEQLVEGHMVHKRRIARLILDDSDYKNSHTAEQLTQLMVTIGDIDGYELEKGRKLAK